MIGAVEVQAENERANKAKPAASVDGQANRESPWKRPEKELRRYADAQIKAMGVEAMHVLLGKEFPFLFPDKQPRLMNVERCRLEMKTRLG